MAPSSSPEGSHQMTLAVALLACLCCALAVVSYRQRQKRQAAGTQLTLLETRHQQSLAAVESRHDQLSQALNCLSEGVLLGDSHGKIVWRNNAADTFAQTRHGNALVEATILDHLAQSSQGKTTNKEIQLYGPPEQTLLLNTFPLPDSHAVAVMEDISHLLRHEVVRRDLVTNIGHELRTPVGALSVLADAMANEDNPEVLLSLSHSISKESTRLTQIVEDLLELSQLERSQLDLNQDSHVTTVAMQDIIGRAVTRAAGVANQNNSEIQVELEAEPVYVSGDSFQLTSAVYNLLENAIKYSSSGMPVYVSLKNTERVAEVAVRDQGVGIPRSDQARVFERFYRVDRSRSAKVGSGLGLSLVRHVAWLHAGEISLESEEGVGSTFILRLPNSQAAACPN